MFTESFSAIGLSTSFFFEGISSSLLKEQRSVQKYRLLALNIYLVL